MLEFDALLTSRATLKIGEAQLGPTQLHVVTPTLPDARGFPLLWRWVRSWWHRLVNWGWRQING